jgi:hypothetical protein
VPLLGHKSDHVTTHYSAPEIGALIEASEGVRTEVPHRRSCEFCAMTRK